MSGFTNIPSPGLKAAALDFAPGPLIRCVCALMICITHLSGLVWYRVGMTGPGQDIFLPTTTYMFFTKTGAVAFLMLAGAALVPRAEMGITAYLSRRLRRWLPSILFAQALYLGWNLGAGRLSPSSLSWFDLLAPAHYHLWFFYAIGLIYVAVVPMQWYARQAETVLGRGRVVALALPLVPPVAMMITMAFRGGAWGDLTLANLVIYCGYAWTGYLLARHPAKTCWPGAVLVVLGIAATILTTIILSEATGIPERRFMHRCWLGIGCLAVGQFMLLQQLDRRITAPAIRARIARLGKLTLGVFIIHPLLLTVLGWPHAWIAHRPSAWIDLPLAGIALFAASALIVSAYFGLAAHLPFVPVAWRGGGNHRPLRANGV